MVNVWPAYQTSNMWLMRKVKRKGVILPMERYEQMTEDLHDLAVVAERREEDCVSLAEMKRRPGQNGEL